MRNSCSSATVSWPLEHHSDAENRFCVLQVPGFKANPSFVVFAAGLPKMCAASQWRRCGMLWQILRSFVPLLA